MSDPLVIKVTKTEVDQAIVSLTKLLAGAKAASGGVDSLATESAALEKKLKTMAKTNTTVTTSLLNMSSKLKVVGRDMSRYITLPLTAMAVASLKFSNDLNTAMGNVQTLIPETGNRIYELRDAVLETSADTGKGFDDLTSAMYRTISVFQDGTDTVDRFNTAVRASVAGYSTAEQAVGLLSAVTRAYGDTSSEAVDRVADLAFEAVRLGDTTFPALSTAMQVATDRAVRLGVSQEELFTTMGTLTGITGDASMVATQFRSAMDGLLSPTDTMIELYKQLGVANGEAMIAEYGLIDSLKIINDTAEKSGISLRDLITRKEGVTLVSRLATQQEEDFRSKLVQVTNGVGAADQAYRDATTGINKFGYEIGKTKQSIIGLSTELGDKLQPILSSLLESVNNAIISLSKVPTGVQYVLIGLSALLAVTGPLVIAWGALANATHSLELAIAGFNAQLVFTVGTIALATGAAILLTAGIISLVKAHNNYTKALEQQEAIDRGTERALEQAQSVYDLTDSYGELTDALYDSNAEATLTSEQYELLNNQYPDLVTGLSAYNVELGVNKTKLTDIALALKSIQQAQVAQEIEAKIPALKVLDEEYADALREWESSNQVIDIISGFIDEEGIISGLATSWRNIGISTIDDLRRYREDIVVEMSRNKLGANTLSQEMINREASTSLEDKNTREYRIESSTLQSHLSSMLAVYNNYSDHLQGVDNVISSLPMSPDLIEVTTARNELFDTLNRQGASYGVTIGRAMADGIANSGVYTVFTEDLIGASSVGGLDLSSVKDGVTKDWEDIFSDVTDIPLSRFLSTDDEDAFIYWDSAAGAVASYRAELETLTSNDLSILRFDENESDIYKERLEKVKSEIVNLVRTMPEEISSDFGSESGFMEEYLFDGIITPMQETIDEYQTLYQNAKFDEVFKELEDSFNNIDIISSGADAIEEKIKVTQEVLDSLATDGNFDILDERFVRLSEFADSMELDFAFVQLQESLEAIDDKSLDGLLTDSESLDEQISAYSTAIEYLLEEGVDPLNAGFSSLVSTLHELEQVNPFDAALESMSTFDDMINKVKLDLFNFFQEMELSSEVSAVFADATGDLVSNALSGFSDALVDAGTNMGELLYYYDDLDSSTSIWDGARIALRDYVLSLAEAIPDLMQAAGLSLISDGQYVLGLSLYLGAAAASVVSGYASAAAEDDTVDNLTSSAQGNVFSTFSKGASLSALSNSVVNTPHYFPMANGTGLLGEAGAEGVLPLARTSSGDLGVQSVGSGSNVSVVVQNYTSSDVTTESSTSEDGTTNIVVKVKNIMKSAISSGDMDKSLTSRFNGISAKGA